MRSGCQLILTRLSSLYSQEGNTLVSLNHTFLGLLYITLSVKYPWVVLDSWLTWRVHLDVRIKKAHNMLWTCRRACGVTCGLSPKMVHWLYISIIRPSITSAPLVWWPDCQTTSAMKRLSGVQRLACLGITRVIRTTPTSAMEAFTCLPPLKLVVQSEARSAVHHLWNPGCWSYLHPS